MTDLSGFIWQHREDDPAKLALSGKKHPDMPIAFVARQVEALQIIRKKAPSWYRLGIEFPLRLSLEQASSEACARFKASLFVGNQMADLTGGMGVDAYAFAQQFRHVTVVEQVAEIAAVTRKNFETLKATHIQVLNQTAEQFLSENTTHFDLIYLDPARRDAQQKKVFNWADCTPNVLEIKQLLFKHSTKVLLKSAPVLDIHLSVKQLEQVSRVWVIEWLGEVREVLYELCKETPAASAVSISAVVLNPEGLVVHGLTFNWQDEAETPVTYGPALQYLYEPSPAVIKAGAFRTFAKQYGLIKLHPNTHLYTSDELKIDVPARVFQVDAVCKYDKKSVHSHLTNLQANITTRNFPDGAEHVRKKLGLRDGGNQYVLAATDYEENLQLLICRKA